MDVSAHFWDAVLRQARSQNLNEDELRKLKSKHILRALSRRPPFLTAAADVAKTVQAVGELCRRHRRDFIQPGACSEAERDRIEAEIGQYIRACTENITRLEGSIPDAAEVTSGKAGINATTAAHFHGVCLLLSERLQHVGRTFDYCRSVRYQHLQRQRQKRSATQAAGVPVDQWAGNSSGGGDPIFPGAERQPQRQQQQAQTVSDAENAALQQMLLSMNQDVTRMERSMQEVAMLNQMFSTQVAHQSEQIEHIYSQAVQTSLNVTKANVHLRKAIAYNAAARRYVLVLLLAASFGLLFLDWYYSGKKKA